MKNPKPEEKDITSCNLKTLCELHRLYNIRRHDDYM
jgi:hypothetical protein